MEENILKQLSFKRLLVYFVGLLIYAFAVCLMTKANAGISPITSIAYIFTCFTSLTLGTTQFLLNLVLVVAQAIWLGREFPRIQYLQIVASFIFSIFIDLIMEVVMIVVDWRLLTVVTRGALLGASLVIMAVGLGIVAIAGVVMLPGDGMAKTIAYKLGLDFGKAKALNDCLCVICTCVISIAIFRRVEGVRIGTVIFAVALGNLARLMIKYSSRPLMLFMEEIE